MSASADNVTRAIGTVTVVEAALRPVGAASVATRSCTLRNPWPVSKGKVSVVAATSRDVTWNDTGSSGDAFGRAMYRAAVTVIVHNCSRG